ncbi:hypothetical protein [Anaerosalibacter massiliensis]|uniref:hypothetical protein n=1 Tax=Anaerosalibacter massiliensis TaxID=1347392 RepID=UPI0005B298A3|nr:hypothetical protein [Anaerosalibacter massiliensis]
MQKRVLIISSKPLEANESASVRKILTVKSILDTGADVTILSTQIPKNSPNYNNNTDAINMAKKVELRTGAFYNAGITKTNKINNKSVKRKLKSLARSMYYKLTIYDPLKGCTKYIDKLEDKLESKYDIIISMSDPKSSHLLALTLLEKGIVSCGRYIQVWGDPMYLDITNKTLIPRQMIKKEERKLLKRPDKVFYVSPLTLEEEKKIFPEYADKMDVLFPIYQKKSIYEPVTKINKIGYFGDYNSDIRDIMPLYNAIKDSDYELVICGNSDLKLKSKSNININGRVSFDKVKEFEKEVDLLVHISNSSGTQIPGKIYQYMGTNKPILFVLDGPKECFLKVFEPFNRVMFCENKKEDIIKTIKRFNNGDFDLEIEPVKEFDNKNLAIKLLDYIM